MSKLLLLIGTPLLALAQSGRSSALDGQIRNSITGQPIPKSELTLRPTGLGRSYTAVADEAGHFVLEGLDPGRYQLSASRAGFVRSDSGALQISIQPGQDVNNLSLTLVPQAVIAGHVTDENGEPMPAVQVQALAHRYNRGHKELAPRGTSITNDLGEFRIFGLPEGRYYLSAIYRANALIQTAAPNVASDQDYLPTFYPRGTDPTFATIIGARPGAHLTSIDFTLSKSPGNHLRGRVITPNGGIAMIRLAPADRTRMLDSNRTYLTDRQGRFDIVRISPGPYIVIASLLDVTSFAAAYKLVDIGNDIDDLVLAMDTPIQVSGRILTEGDGSPDLSKVRINLRPQRLGITSVPLPLAQPRGDGTFLLQNVSPDQYAIVPIGLPDGYYAKSITLGDEHVMDSGVDLNASTDAPITILLSPHAATIAGSVLDHQRKSTRNATVVLVAKGQERRNNAQFYASTTVDQDGHFAIPNLPPGTYQAFAWERTEYDAWMDPDFMKPFENVGVLLNVREDEQALLTLRAIAAIRTPER